MGCAGICVYKQEDGTRKQQKNRKLLAERQYMEGGQELVISFS